LQFKRAVSRSRRAFRLSTPVNGAAKVITDQPLFSFLATASHAYTKR
jgi:hypothetical protein